VVQKSVAADVLIDGIREDLEALGAKILPFTAEEAEIAGQLWLQTRTVGLSLGDRACLSLGIRLQAPVLTADQIWITLKLPVTVHSIRPPI
jgi:PIN domain nuclease of toxin-antitoxin system